MKKYYGYSESSSKTYWNYYKEKGYVYKSEDYNIHIRYCAFCNAKDMIDIIGEKVNSRNWIKERIAETGNATDIELSNSNIGYIVVRDTKTGEIIDKLEIIKKRGYK